MELFKPGSPHHHAVSRQDLQSFLAFRQSLSRTYLENLLDAISGMQADLDKNLEILVAYDARRPDPGIDLSGIQALNSDYSITWQYIPKEHDLWRPAASPFTVQQVRINPPASGNAFAPGMPTRYPTGTGLYNRLLFLKNHGQRIILFSESSLYEVDAHMLPFIASSGHHEAWTPNDVQVHAPHSGEIIFSGGDIKGISVNGVLSANFSKKHFLVPAGHITLSPSVSGNAGLSASLKSKTRVVDFSEKMEEYQKRVKD